MSKCIVVSKAFSDETTAALKLQNDCPDDTFEFLTKLVKFFKIANVKGQFEDVHSKDETRAVCHLLMMND